MKNRILLIFLTAILAVPTFGQGKDTIQICGYEFLIENGGMKVVKDSVIDGIYHTPYKFKYQYRYKLQNITVNEYFSIVQEILNDMGDKRIGKMIKRWKMGVGNVPIQHKQIGFQYNQETFTMFIYII